MLSSSMMRDRINSSIAAYREQPGPLLLVLHAIQRDFGYVPAEAVPLIAEGLNLSRAEVHGVLTFYHHFRSSPPGKHIVRICRAEACQAMQSEKLAAYAQQRLGISFHETTADGKFSLEPVYCLGNCGCSPALMIDAELHGRVSPRRFDELIAERT